MMEGTNQYNHSSVDSLDTGPCVLYITEATMFVFLVLTIQMGHSVSAQLTDYWATIDQLYTPFYSSMMKQDIVTHPTVLTLNTQQEQNDKEQNFDKQQKILHT